MNEDWTSIQKYLNGLTEAERAEDEDDDQNFIGENSFWEEYENVMKTSQEKKKNATYKINVGRSTYEVDTDTDVTGPWIHTTGRYSSAGGPSWGMSPIRFSQKYLTPDPLPQEPEYQRPSFLNKLPF